MVCVLYYLTVEEEENLVGAAFACIDVQRRFIELSPLCSTRCVANRFISSVLVFMHWVAFVYLLVVVFGGSLIHVLSSYPLAIIGFLHSHHSPSPSCLFF